MTYCPDYYNPDEYVREFYEATEPQEEPTKCDCGQECHKGHVYCEYCSDVISTAMDTAVGNIMRFCDYDKDTALDAIAHWMNYPEQFEEEK